jgi:hypothetical protein
MEDPQFAELISHLMNASEEFHTAWERHDVVGRRNVCKQFEHPTIGQLSFEQTTLLVSESLDYRLVVKIPLPETDTLEKLKTMLATAELG